MTWPTHQPTHSPTHQTIHSLMGGGVSTDFKSLNRIEISWLVQVLLNFDCFWGSPFGGGGLGGWRWGVVTGCPPHMCTCTCACMYDIIGNSHGFHQWGRPFAWNYHVYQAYMCMRVHVHPCACVCGATPTTPHPHLPTPHSHPPTPPTTQSCREPKTPKFNNSWTNQDNLILLENSLPLNILKLI